MSGIPGIVIREPVASDAEALAAYTAALVAEGTGTITLRTAPTVEQEADFIAGIAARDRAFILIAAEDERIVGLLDLHAGGREHNRHSAHFGMSVAKDKRGQGLGRQLLEDAIEKTKAWPGFCRIELEVFPHNTAAIRLYESAGFELEARKTKAVNLEGKPEDLLLMALTW
ncbi:MAG TPA: GNAT family N-acetyltransferase [Hyphomonadaceae bacterium]|jgi:RimJ/RimL family protein N-acetyltransferase|nr:GNAT family N-acetyltransferase [Hyphomonadaceae bacterium]